MAGLTCGVVYADEEKALEWYEASLKASSRRN